MLTLRLVNLCQNCNFPSYALKRSGQVVLYIGNVSICIAELDPSVSSINSNALDPSRLREMLHRPPSVRSRPQRTPLLKLRDFTSTSESTPQTDRSLGILKRCPIVTLCTALYIACVGLIGQQHTRQADLSSNPSMFLAVLVKTSNCLRRRTSAGSS